MALPSSPRLRFRHVLLAAALLAAAPLPARAGSDYSNHDFSVRFAAGFIRFTEVSTMGGESAANRYSSAINPAAAGWLSLPGKLGIVAAPYYSHICFGEGTDIRVSGEALVWDSRQWGTFRPVLAQIRSNDETLRNGMKFGYTTDTGELTWAKRFGNCAFGANFNFAEAETTMSGRFSTMGLTTRVHTEGEAESYRFRFGGLWEPAEKWLIGSVFEYGFQPFRSRTVTRTAIPQPPMTLTSTMSDEGTQQQFIFRPAVSYEYAPMSCVYADYQYGAFFNKYDELHAHHFTVGVDHRLLECLMGRTSVTFDAKGNVGFAVGTTLFVSEWCSIDFAYQYDMLPELRPDFGRSHTLQGTIALRF